MIEKMALRDALDEFLSEGFSNFAAVVSFWPFFVCAALTYVVADVVRTRNEVPARIDGDDCDPQEAMAGWYEKRR